ncbi:MAG: hypothetical protein CO170_01605 [candidate division SR1 bacterium CG_4_9_14_3_um_filter_40_9]|nr:MAG: hypothetical protein CO170_01605 [candidate division SR1 bacterium CG_4_9_14_3_um_filter_40_9]
MLNYTPPRKKANILPLFLPGGNWCCKGFREKIEKNSLKTLTNPSQSPFVKGEALTHSPLLDKGGAGGGFVNQSGEKRKKTKLKLEIGSQSTKSENALK